MMWRGCFGILALLAFLAWAVPFAGLWALNVLGFPIELTLKTGLAFWTLVFIFGPSVSKSR